jgi:hypothetical protein
MNCLRPSSATIVTGGGAAILPNVPVAAALSNQANATPGTVDYDFGDEEGLIFLNGRLEPVWADNSGSTGGNPNGAHSDFDICTAVTLIGA